MRLFLLLSLLLAAAAPAQSLEDYLKLRKQYGITQAVGIQALETFVGKRTMEIKGTVKGSLTVNGKTVLLVERTDGESISVTAENAPDWLMGNEITARLLVHGERIEEYAPLQAELIGAASDSSISAVEAEVARKAAAAAAKTKPPKPKGLTGPIGSMSGTSGKPINWNLPPSQAAPYYAGFIKARNKKLSDKEAWKIAEGILGFSIRYGVDARLILAMVLVESGFNPSATSNKGAMGLGQLMPGTAGGMGITNAYDTNQNLYGTVRIIRGHIERYYAKTGSGYDSLVLALAAYNAGSGSVRRFQGVPPYQQTQNYIQKVLSVYLRFLGRK